MKRQRKSNRVTWAPGVNLCQVKLFLTEDCPSKIGTQSQGHLQKKSSWILHHSNGDEFSDVPPGFECGHSLNLLKKESSLIPRIEWKCPPKLVMCHNWHVAAGEESREAEAQKLREMEVLEAVFLRPSAIPHSPSISLAIEGEHYDDSHTPIIPLTPIEEEAVADLPSDLSSPLNTSVNSQPSALPQDLLLSGILNLAEYNNLAQEPPASEKPIVGISPDMDADVVTAASAAATALMKSLEKGSLIDTDLLVKILSDPKMIEKLINNCQAPSIVTSATMITSKPVNRTILPSRLNPAMTSALTPAEGNWHNLRGGLQPTSKPPPSCLKSTIPTAPIPPNGCLHSALDEMLPPVTRMPAQPDTDPTSRSKQVAPSITLSRPESINVSATRPRVANLYSSTNQVQSTVSTVKPNPVPNVVLPSLGMMALQPNGAPQTKVVAMKTNPIKDFNYIKNLIREHGSEKKEMHERNMLHTGLHHEHFQNLEFAQNMNQRETIPRFQKPCIFYRSSRGCRNGSNCPYQHDLSFQFQTGGSMEAPGAKRMKLGGEITG
ncbi:hypothetical protein P3X46_029195 [Hevea brasiliensis]|uniref:C3H1-type domain-containing protein n=1 Tax=Hevea brasiliensis TaxID=3981 RepID=A0ABQ9KRI1_HEVBR|nr:zinc finger CCCH domain-containing protein 30 [Hevea brasiliensis]KAJ9146983.1 hypothetical protein P3X46_029195 [Hevea brasiliensis]